MDLDLAKLLGASGQPSAQRLTFYVPNKDRVGELLADFENWTTEAQNLLTKIGGGASSFPPVDGTWQKPDGGVLWEQTRIIYTYIDPDNLEANVSQLRSFLHRFGRETNQGEVVFEFDGWFFSIKDFDALEGE